MLRYVVAVVFGLLMSLNASAECSAVCDPEVSKPCGLVCISKYKRCHKPTTSACMGKPGRSTKKVYDNPTKVEPSEQQKANDEADGRAS